VLAARVAGLDTFPDAETTPATSADTVAIPVRKPVADTAAVVAWETFAPADAPSIATVQAAHCSSGDVNAPGLTVAELEVSSAVPVAQPAVLPLLTAVKFDHPDGPADGITEPLEVSRCADATHSLSTAPPVGVSDGGSAFVESPVADVSCGVPVHPEMR
jgi:hypothetical protein